MGSLNMDYLFFDTHCSSPYEAHLKKNQSLCQKGDNCTEIATGHFQKSQKLLTEGAPQKAALFTTLNSYLFNFDGGLCHRPRLLSVTYAQPGRPAVSMIFWNMTLCDFTAFFLFLESRHKLTFVCRSEEVTSFFWRSLYYQGHERCLINLSVSLRDYLHPPSD